MKNNKIQLKYIFKKNNFKNKQVESKSQDNRELNRRNIANPTLVY